VSAGDFRCRRLLRHLTLQRLCLLPALLGPDLSAGAARDLAWLCPGAGSGGGRSSDDEALALTLLQPKDAVRIMAAQVRDRVLACVGRDWGPWVV
jgi:hypothetical protein